MGMVTAAKHHKFHTHNKALLKKVQGISKGISLESANHFARTPEAGLPEKVAAPFEQAAKFLGNAVKDKTIVSKATQRLGKFPQYTGELHPTIKGDLERSNDVVNRFSPTSGILAKPSPVRKMVAGTIKEVRNLRKESFVKGFLKAAEVYGVQGEQLEQQVKLAGLDKEAFLGPLIAGGIRLAAPLAGMLGSSWLFDSLATQAAKKELPDWLAGGRFQKFMGSMAHKTTKPLAAGDVVESKRPWYGDALSMGSSVPGMFGAQALAEPIARQFDPPPVNQLPQFDSAGYTQ